MIALLDGDIIAHRAASTWRADQDWAFGYKVQVSADDVRQWAVNMALEWAAKAGCDQSIVCLSPKDRRTFRHLIDPEYKANRRGTERPEHLDAAVAGLEAHFECARLAMLEADDVMGILGTSTVLRDTVVVTIDKDLRGVPCRFFNPYHEAAPRRIEPLEADLFWMTQTLTGDPVDGYKGCPGIGKAKAWKALLYAGDFTALWDTVADLFARANIRFEEAVQQARLSRILRRDDYHGGEIALWHPTRPQRLKLT